MSSSGPFNFFGNTMAEWKMRQLLRLLEAGGKVTITLEIPQREETEADDADKFRSGKADTSEGSENDDVGGEAGGTASE